VQAWSSVSTRWPQCSSNSRPDCPTDTKAASTSVPYTPPGPSSGPWRSSRRAGFTLRASAPENVREERKARRAARENGLFWRSPRMSVRQRLCRADNRPDSLSLQRAQGTVGARSSPITKSAQTLPKIFPVADRSSLVLRVEQAEDPYPPSLPRGAARPVGVLPTRPSWCDLGGLS
jgi:hypothetical protein